VKIQRVKNEVKSIITGSAVGFCRYDSLAVEEVTFIHGLYIATSHRSTSLLARQRVFAFLNVQ